MLKELVATTLSVITMGTILPAHAEKIADSCFVEVAISSPPVLPSERVAFNVSNNSGIYRSLTLSGGSAAKIIEKLPCYNVYAVSATLYSNDSNPLMNAPVIGQCTLKAGEIALNDPSSNISVVFPFDFNCG
ncbi:hypothetical protein [Legionella nagasakiensis]|uniref:hypothetical protein n=1 Tax=Legionella nagasakiensis TaxID=535290 RepID=UPI001054E3DE|nr:hypothetical protein [Legionella nagasakiensis]